MTSSTRTVVILTKIAALPGGQLWVFALKQAWAALFGGLLLIAIVITNYVELPWLSRYDWLFVIAIAIQGFMLLTKLEKPHEIVTILCFHLVGLGMELFKTSSSISSWTYPEESVIVLSSVPLFSGFMYGAVGSYIARCWRVMNLKFSHYPKRRYTILLAFGIYINFFTHHYVYDFRYVLFAFMIILYWRSWTSYTVAAKRRCMPLLVSAALVAFVIWLAENLSTFANIWLYPSQVEHWHMVGVDKFGSWLLLIVISFVMVDLLHFIRAKKVAVIDSDY